MFVNKQIKIFLSAFVGVVMTYYINHNIGYGALIANGIVGIIAATLLAPDLAGAMYTASFVGMSGVNVIPSLFGAAIGGVIVGLVIIFTIPVYSGIGGKGGTTAAFSTLVTKTLLSVFT